MQHAGRLRDMAWASARELADTTSDEALYAAWIAGDQKAGQALVQRYYSEVARFIRRRLSGMVDDVLQQTFLSVMHSGARYRGDASFRTYLLATARLQVLAHIRRVKRAPASSEALESVADERTEQHFSRVEHEACAVLTLIS